MGKSGFWIIGAGRFGKMAAERLSARYPGASMLVVDKSEDALGRLSGLPVSKIQGDGAAFLEDCLQGDRNPTWIVPAVPVHLAFEWLKKKINHEFEVINIDVPGWVDGVLPNPFRAGKGVLYASYADFTCPDNCSEPGDFCTVTGKKRKGKLYRDFAGLDIDGFVSVGIRSLQLAPGVGGYAPGVLQSVLETVRQTGDGKNFLLSTACLCHGVMNAFKLDAIDINKKPMVV